MASPYDLTNLAAVKAWLNVTNANSDVQLASLITAASRIVYAYINRDLILPHPVTMRLDGYGGRQRRIILPEFPVLSISSMMIDTTVIPIGAPISAANPNFPNGFLLDPWDGSPPGIHQGIDVYGYGISLGRRNILIVGTAGYQVTNEAAVVPANPGPYTLTSDKLAQPFGAWGSDAGVTRASGAALTKVAGAPAASQYSLSVASATGIATYTFNSADQGAPLLISYGFIPADLAEVATELVGERFRYKDRIGQGSKTLGGQETITFTQKEMPDALKLALNSYKSIVAG